MSERSKVVQIGRISARMPCVRMARLRVKDLKHFVCCKVDNT